MLKTKNSHVKKSADEEEKSLLQMDILQSAGYHIFSERKVLSWKYLTFYLVINVIPQWRTFSSCCQGSDRANFLSLYETRVCLWFHWDKLGHNHMNKVRYVTAFLNQDPVTVTKLWIARCIKNFQNTLILFHFFTK